MNTFRIGDVLRKSTETINIDNDREYKQITVKLYNKGAILRGIKKGKEIGTKRQFLARKGQLILSKIDAKSGAFSLVPTDLDGAIVTSDFPLYNCNLELVIPEYFSYFVRTSEILNACIKASKGTTNRQRLKESIFLEFPINLPSITLQRKIVEKLKISEEKLESIYLKKKEINILTRKFTLSYFSQITKDSNYLSMLSVAPLVRRKVKIESELEYPELGIRSFGKGTFHKPPLKGSEVGTKKLYEIYPGDLVFSNVFAWEGAVALASENDDGRFGSHRFITCIPQKNIILPEFLLFFFLTPMGLNLLGKASPGGAGRNRTLNIKKLEKILIPIPDLELQEKFVSLLTKLDHINVNSSNNLIQANKILPSLLHNGFSAFTLN